MEPRTARAQTAPAIYAGVAVAAAIGFALVCAAVVMWGRTGPLPVDTAWAQVMHAIRAPWLSVIALVCNVVGGVIVSGFVLPIGGVMALLLLRRPMAAVFVAAASAATAVIVQLCKVVVARPRPEVIEVHTNFASFPSGHSATAAALVITLALVLGTWRWINWAGPLYVLVMMASRNYLGAHWLSDTVAGALLGVAATLGVWLLFRRALRTEAERAGLVGSSIESSRV